MTPDQAVELLHAMSVLAFRPKADHIKCEQARATLLNALRPPDKSVEEAPSEPADEDYS